MCSITSRTQSPCYDCKDRHLLCHSDCSKYAAFRNEIDEYNNTRYKLKAVNDDVYSTPGRVASRHKIWKDL